MNQPAKQNKRFDVRQYLPFLDWMVHYNRGHLTGDIIAGLIVAIMLIPQSMAYALLAGLPPQMGLYASILPLIVYGLLGTSRALAVGPVAMVSLLVASALGSLELNSVTQYVQLALVLAILAGLIQLLMGFLRIGFLVNFLSHPVLSGFTSAVAIVIGLSQFKHLIGVDVARTESMPELASWVIGELSNTNITVLILSTISIAILLYFKLQLKHHLTRLNLPEHIIAPITKLGPLIAVVVGIAFVTVGQLDIQANVPIVGNIPAGLPSFVMPVLDIEIVQELVPFAFTIAIVGYLESISVAKALASRRREKVDANQELIALGAANISASFTGGYPIAGGFSRSVVNFAAGANTGLASIITAILIGLTMLLFTPLFYYLPNAVLGAIILVAVTSLFDWATVRHTWDYDKADFTSLAVTFLAVLIIGIETGILVGVATSIGLYLWRTSRPHVAIVGQIGNTEEYRNILRHENVTTHKSIIAMRVDESLYFPNTQYLDEIIHNTIADNPQAEHFILIFSAVNFIDSSALDTLESLHHSLKLTNIELHCAGVKGPVMDRLHRIGFVDRIGENHFYLNTHEAFTSILKTD